MRLDLFNFEFTFSFLLLAGKTLLSGYHTYATGAVDEPIKYTQMW